MMHFFRGASSRSGDASHGDMGAAALQRKQELERQLAALVDSLPNDGEKKSSLHAALGKSLFVIVGLMTIVILAGVVVPVSMGIISMHLPEFYRGMANRATLVGFTPDAPLCSLTRSAVGTAADFQGTASLRHRQCFDYGRPGCRTGSFTVALYPPISEAELDRLGNSYERESASRSTYFVDILKAVRQSPYFVEDPALACVLVPSLDHAQGGTEYITGDHMMLAGVRLHQLDAWKSGAGRNFLLFNFHDKPTIEFDAGHAMVAKAGWSERFYRPGFDLSIPAPGIFSNMGMLRDGWTRWSREPDRTPKYFATFLGRMTSECRHSLESLHDPSNGVVVRTRSDSESYDYAELLTDTQFAFCPRGNGLYSYRLHEAVSAGAIPVIIGDDAVLPFPELLDWRSIGVVIPEARAADAVQILRDIPAEAVRTLRCRLFQAARHLMWGVDGIVNATLENLRSNVRGPAAGNASGTPDLLGVDAFSHPDMDSCGALEAYAAQPAQLTRTEEAQTEHILKPDAGTR